MRRLRLFLSKFLLSLWIILFGSFLFLLMVEFRGGGVTQPIAGVFINEAETTVALPNRIFTCTNTDSQTQCQTTIQDRLLILNLLSSGNGEVGYRGCQATYGGRSVSCNSRGLQYAPMLSEEFELRDLDLSPDQLQAVQRKYWGIRTLLTLGERRLMRVSTGLAIVAGAIAAYFTWFYPSRLSRGLASVSWGFVIYQFVKNFLGSVQFDTVTSYGFTVNSWIWIANYGSAIVGITAAIAVAWLLRRRTDGVTKTLVTLSNGFGSVFIVGNFLLLMLLSSGFAD